MEKAAIKKTTLFLLLVYVTTISRAQQVTPPLERKVSVEFGGDILKDVLVKVENKANFSFAYKTGVFNENQIINRAYINKTVREILDDIFQGDINYKTKGNYVLLRKNPKIEGDEVIIEGYVIDNITKEKIAYATIYDIYTLSSAVSDEYGHYMLKLDENRAAILKAKKLGYSDADFVYKKDGPSLITIQMSPIAAPKMDSTVNNDTNQIVVTDSTTLINRIQSLKWLKLKPETKANITNFRELMKGKTQFSIVPNVGTYGKLTSSTSFDYSFNFLGGFVGGVRKLELGLGFNLDLDTVKYVQAAGLFNAVGGPQYGVQGAGVFNLNLSSFEGVQLAGTSNLVRGDFKGVQFSGFNNLNLGKTEGLQLAGTTNFAWDSSYVGQVSGFFNFARNDNQMFQVAGFANYAHKSNLGSQVAGFANIANSDYRGHQVAGFSNISIGSMQGGQVAGFLNVADKINGYQVGFLNISDSISGIPVGFLSYSRAGLHQLELSTNEALPAQLAFKTGVNSFYNSFLAAGRFENNYDPVVGIGYGVGTSIRLGERSRVFFDLQAMQLFNDFVMEANSLNKLTVSYQFKPKKNFAVAFGPSLNLLYLNNTYLTKTADLQRIAPYSFYEYTNPNGRAAQMWVGGHVAIRLF